jgi:hypothetical protein
LILRELVKNEQFKAWDFKTRCREVYYLSGYRAFIYHEEHGGVHEILIFHNCLAIKCNGTPMTRMIMMNADNRETASK